MSGVKGVYFGQYHSFDDWGLLLSEKSIGTPTVQTEYVSIPGRNGDLDFSQALTGQLCYGNRELVFTFSTTENLSGLSWGELLSTVSAALHGQRLKILLEEEPDWYFLGRCSVDSLRTSRRAGTLVISCKAEPLRYWTEGEGRYTTTVTVTDSLVLSLDNPGPATWPTLICSGEMTLCFGEESYALSAGTTELYELLLEPGENTLSLYGNGTVELSYCYGRL